MRKFYFLSMVAGTVLAYSSCSNDLVEEVSEEVTEHVQTGTPMNFSAKMGGKVNINVAQSGKRRLRYDDENRSYVEDANKGAVNLQWEQKDKIGINCPDAFDTQTTVYQVTADIFDTEGFGSIGFLESTDAPLKWGEKEVHRVFYGYPAGKIEMGDVEEPESGESYEFTRKGSITIDKCQTGKVEEAKIFPKEIHKDENPIEGYRVVDKQNMICGGVSIFNKSEVSQDEPIELNLDSYYTAFDVVFTNDDEQSLTIKTVSIVADSNAENQFTALSGKADVSLGIGDGYLLAINSIEPTSTESFTEVSIAVKDQNGTATFALPKGKSLSVILCTLPWVLNDVAGDKKYERMLKGKLKVTYNYDGEVEQTKTLDISGKHWMNSRNRIVVPALPHAASTNS